MYWYLKGTSGHGLFLRNGDGKFDLNSWSDADCARDHANRRSRSGFVLQINSGSFIYSSKLQTVTSQSTAEAQFRSLSATVRETVWVLHFLRELGIVLSGPTHIYRDNLGAIAWTQEVQGLRKVKHIGIKYHYYREPVASKEVTIEYVPSAHN